MYNAFLSGESDENWIFQRYGIAVHGVLATRAFRDKGIRLHHQPDDPAFAADRSGVDAQIVSSRSVR